MSADPASGLREPGAAHPARSPSALLALPIAFAAVTGGVLALILVTAIRDALVDAPLTISGNAGAAAHGDPPVIVLLSTLTQDIVLVTGVMWAVAAGALGTARSLPAALSLRMPQRPGRAVALVGAAYLIFLAISAAWISLLGITDRENVAVSLGTRDSTAALIGAIVLVCAVAPLAEEIFFRGFLFRALRRYGLVVATLVSGLAFGLAHVASSPIGFIVPLAVLGVLLALLLERTGSLYPSIGLHWLNNSVAFAVGDGRAWLAPVCMVISGVLIVATLALLTRRSGPAREVAV